MPQSVVRMTWQGLLRTDLDYTAAEVVNHCLGGETFSSRLYKELRETRGLCYSVDSSHLAFDHAGLLVATTATRNERVAEAIGAIETEVSKLVEDGIEREELEKAKRYMIASEAMRIDSSRQLSHYLTSLQLQGRGPDYAARRAAAIASVGLEDTARVIRRIFATSGAPLTVAVGEPVGVRECQL